MEKAIKKFYNLQNVAKAYSNQYQICMFLRERSFQAVWNFVSQPGFPQQDKEQMSSLYNQFSSEAKSSGWDSKTKIEKQFYSQFLEYFYKQNSFSNADFDTLNVCLHLTEELSFWGQLDKLTNDRINYFHKKINNILQSQQPAQNQQFGLESQTLLKYNEPSNFMNNNNNNNNHQNNNNMQQQQQQQQQQPYQAGNFNVNNYQQNQNAYNNNNNNNNYSNASGSNYLDNFGNPGLPLKVDPRFARKISKREPAYKELREIIERHIEYANLELDYHNVHEAKERLIAAQYYLANIVE